MNTHSICILVYMCLLVYVVYILNTCVCARLSVCSNFKEWWHIYNSNYTHSFALQVLQDIT